MAFTSYYLILIYSLLSISSCIGQTSFQPKGLILPVTKDSSTLQYITQIGQRTLLVPIKLTIHLGGQALWVDCEDGYVSSTYRPARCDSAQCTISKVNTCGNCTTAPKIGCNNNACYNTPENPFIKTLYSGGEINEDVLSIQSTDGSNPGGNGGTKISTGSPYSILESSIYDAVTKAFIDELSNVTRVADVAPFEVCFSSKSVGSTKVGPAVPSIDLVLQTSRVYWRIFGANSMVNGELNPTTSIVIRGYQLEDNLLQFDLARSTLGFSSSLLFSQTTCANFNFTSKA